MSDKDIVAKVTAKFTGKLYVGARVRIKCLYGYPLAGKEAVITEIDSYSNLVSLHPPLTNDGRWNRGWLELV